MSILNRRSKSAGNPSGNEGEPKRILVLGSEGHGRAVQAHPWDQLPEKLNVADYEVVILNFTAFEDRALAERFPVDRLPDQSAMARLLFSQSSEVVSIGDPRTLIGPPPDARPILFDRRQRADYWLPFALPVEDNIGESYSVASDDWRPFFDQFSRWQWILSGNPAPMGAFDDAQQYVAPVTDRAAAVSFEITAIAETRFQKPIAVKIQLLAEQILNSRPIPILESGPAYWLPAPDQVSTAEAIDHLLRERYGIARRARVPQWIDGYSLPAEAPIAAEMDDLNQELEERSKLLHAAQGKAEEVARPKQVLFEKGLALEAVVRDVLRELEARVDDPEAEGIEDGLLFQGKRAAVIEVKGRDGGIKQADIRQVVQWASEAKLRDGITYKPLIIANPHCETRLEERGEPLTGNARSYAENGEVGLLTTAQLYEALRQHQLGELDINAFWNSVFNAVGIADLPNPHTPAKVEAVPQRSA